jgi:hypothetical protein
MMPRDSAPAPANAQSPLDPLSMSLGDDIDGDGDGDSLSPVTFKGLADLTKATFDSNKNLTLLFTVHPDDKYSLLPITDIHGRAFALSISCESDRVFFPADAIAEAKARVARLRDGEE